MQSQLRARSFVVLRKCSASRTVGFALTQPSVQGSHVILNIRRLIVPADSSVMDTSIPLDSLHFTQPQGPVGGTPLAHV